MTVKLKKANRRNARSRPEKVIELRVHVKPVRYQDQRCLHFITFSCYLRMPLLDRLAAKETSRQNSSESACGMAAASRAMS